MTPWALVRLAARLALMLAALLVALHTDAQTRDKVPHIGYLWLGAPGSDKATTLPGFRQGLRELGYQEGSNIAGFSFIVTDFGGKWVELLHELVPHATRVAMLWNPVNAASRALVQAARQATGSLGLTLLSDEAGRPEDLPQAFEAIVEQKPDALIIDTDALILSHRTIIIEFAAVHGLPAMYGLREFVDEGGLISYGPSPFDVWRRVAGYVDKILKGTKPADLPVQQPTKFELVVNLNVVRKLGLTIPPSILARVDEVIE